MRRTHRRQDSPDGRAQITRFSVALGGHLGYQAAAHNGGYLKRFANRAW
jgi:hypothetical protein